MSVEDIVQSEFNYPIKVKAGENLLYFEEADGTPFNISVKEGCYTPECLMDEINKALAALGYTITFTYERENNRIRINDSNVFRIKLFEVGSLAFAFQLGFPDEGDLQDDLEYFTRNPLTRKYRVQFCLQSLLRCEDNKRLKDAVVTESISGKYECFHCGEESFFEFNMRFITDVKQDCLFMYSNPNGVQDARDLFDNMICKEQFEFIPDCTKPNEYYTLVLDQTPESREGTGYELKEMYEQGLCGYYETGLLRFKCVEKGE